MNLSTQELLAIITIHFLAFAEPAQKYPLMDQRGDVIVNIGVILLAIGSVIAVKILSPRVEHAIIFAILVSFALVAFFIIK